MTIHLPGGAGYVALGSSFAAGPGLRPRVPDTPRPAGRSTVNYAHLLASSLGLSLTDVTYSGATTADILSSSAAGVPAQAGAVGSDTRLVTITAGGNDISYLGGLTLASVPWLVRSLPSIRRNVAAATDPATMDTRLADMRSSLTRVVALIHDRAPQARIAIVDYLSILPPDLKGVGGVPPAPVARWALAAGARLSESFETVADAEGCTFVPVGAASRDHHAWSAEPWTRAFHLSLRDGAPYHPTYAGMRAVAAMLAEFFDTDSSV